MVRKMILGLLLALVIPMSVSAEEPTMEKVWLTCYRPTGHKTASGTTPRNGVMAAKRDWMGMTAVVYSIKDDGSIDSFIGIYEIEDTGDGKNGAIRKGYVVDIFAEKDADVVPTQKVYMQLIEAKG